MNFNNPTHRAKETWWGLGNQEWLSISILSSIIGGLAIKNILIRLYFKDLESIPFFSFTDSLVALFVLNILIAIHTAYREENLKSGLFLITSLLGLIGWLWDFDIIFSSIKESSINWTIVFFFLFAVFSVLNFSRYLISMHRNKKEPLTKWRYALFLPIFLGLYIVGCIINHWWFFRGSYSVQLFIDKKNLPDVFNNLCSERNRILIRFEKDTAKFRCSSIISFPGRTATQIFFPWPFYSSGESKILKTNEQRLRTESYNRIHESYKRRK